MLEEHPIGVGAKHLGKESIGRSREFLIQMLRPHPGRTFAGRLTCDRLKVYLTFEIKFPCSYSKIMEVQPRDIQRYVTPDGRIPFDEWFDSLRDRKARNKIKARLDRAEQGNLGDCRSIGEGVFELRIDFGPGYRIYFGQVGTIIVLLALLTFG